MIYCGAVGVFTVLGAFIYMLLRVNTQNHEIIVRLSHTLAVYQAAKEGDMDTARLMAAVTREPVSSAGAKQPQGAVTEEEVETGILITQEM